MNTYYKYSRQLAIRKICPLCGKCSLVKINCSESQYNDYMKNYRDYSMKPIQLIFPDLGKTEREILKSGICSNCQNVV